MNDFVKIYFTKISLLSFFVFINCSVIYSPLYAKEVHHHSKSHSSINTKKVHSKKNHPKNNVRKHKYHFAKKVRVMIPNRQPVTNLDAEHSEVNQQPYEKYSFVQSIESRLVHFVQNTVSNLRYSVYKLGASKFDTERGVYVVDCSSYIDNILKNIYPTAFSSLVSYSGTEKPTTQDYYDFFNELSNNNQMHWNKVNDVEALRPGDVLVFRYTNRYGREIGGHLMIVMDKPVGEDNVYWLKVADSAATGHSEDTRKEKVSGIGIGTILLKVDPKTYQPYAFAWRVGSRFNKNVNVAMARPIDYESTHSKIPNYLRFFNRTTIFS